MSSSVGEDEGIVSELQRMIEEFSSTPHAELEARVGRFEHADDGHNFFFAGHPLERKALVGNLIQRLEHQCAMESARPPLERKWTALPPVVMVRSQYSNGVRCTTTSVAGGGEGGQHERNRSDYCRKRSVACVDAWINAAFDLRFELCTEEPIDPSANPAIQKEVNEIRPEAVRLIHRKSFICRTECGATLRYDISKTSPLGDAKHKCVDTPCIYHCELELTDNGGSDPRDVAVVFLSHAKALLGTCSAQDGAPLPSPQCISYVCSR